VETTSQQKALQEFIQVFTAIPFNHMLGLKLDTIESDHIALSFTMKKELIGNFLQGILHGGVISSVLDMTGGVAAMVSAVQKHKEKNIEELKSILGKSSTINLHINYLSPGKGEHFIAKGWVLRSGNKICFTRMELHNQDGAMIASGSGTYLIG
jgi:uncharacterized protein (TIGR00369 family)